MKSRLGFADGSAEKVAMHAAAGALTAILAGGNAGTGALAGGTGVDRSCHQSGFDG